MRNLLLIKTEEQLCLALDRRHDIFNNKSNTPERYQLETLLVLVKFYEEKNVQLLKVVTIEVIEFYLEQRGIIIVKAVVSKR